MIHRFVELFKKFMIKMSPTAWEIYQLYIDVHATVLIDPAVTIKIFNPPASTETLLEIGEGSHIFSTFNLLRPQARIKIGKRCQLGNVNFVCADRIEVQDDVLMAWGITIMDTDSHSLEWEHRKNDVKQCYDDYLLDRNNFIKNKDWSHVASKPIVIESRSWIGFNVSILKGVTIGENAVVGAGSVITEDVPPYCVVAGNPAKVIKKLKPDRDE